MKVKNKNQCAITFAPSMMSVSAKGVYIDVAIAELILSLSVQTELSPERVLARLGGYFMNTSEDNIYSHLENDKKYLLSCIKDEQEHFIKKEF